MKCNRSLTVIVLCFSKNDSLLLNIEHFGGFVCHAVEMGVSIDAL